MVLPRLPLLSALHHGCPSRLTRGAEKFLSELQEEEIYIGMIALRQLPRYEVCCACGASLSCSPHNAQVPSAIEALDEAGVRFVHFSSEREGRVKMFAQKLGLACVRLCWNK
jgi:hypothetical protein